METWIFELMLLLLLICLFVSDWKMYLSKRAIDDFLNFKNHECKMGDTELTPNGYNKEDFEKQEIQIQNHKNQMSKKIQNIQTGKYESYFDI